MPKYHQGEVSRLDDIEALITTTQEMVRRMNLQELTSSMRCISDALKEVREARGVLISKWRQIDSGHRAES